MSEIIKLKPKNPKYKFIGKEGIFGWQPEDSEQEKRFQAFLLKASVGKEETWIPTTEVFNNFMSEEEELKGRRRYAFYYLTALGSHSEESLAWFSANFTIEVLTFLVEAKPQMLKFHFLLDHEINFDVAAMKETGFLDRMKINKIENEAIQEVIFYFNNIQKDATEKSGKSENDSEGDE